MRKAQVSVEFMVIFTIILFFLAVMIALFPQWLEKTTAARDIPLSMANDIKARVITASLSESDFKSSILIPKTINNANVRVDIDENPDNILRITDKDSGRTLARVFLPKVDEVTGNPDGLNLTIIKTGNLENTWIKIEQS